ncbi:MAG: hypothetical protein WBK77_07870 [Alphaproteobacteria bacterium]
MSLGQPIVFLDERDVYQRFSKTTTEKSVIAQTILEQLPDITGGRINIFDAGTGNGAVLSHVVNGAWEKYQKPITAVGKEISGVDVNWTVQKTADHLVASPESVLALTNTKFTHAPKLRFSDGNSIKTAWEKVRLQPGHTDRLAEQIQTLESQILDLWSSQTDIATGRITPDKEAVLVLSSSDVGLQNIDDQRGYDLIIVSQPWQSRASADFKARCILAPLSENLAPGGRLVCVQSGFGDDIATEVIQNVWPGENPYPVSVADLIDPTRKNLSGGLAKEFSFNVGQPFTYDMPRSKINGYDYLETAFTNAAYVAQLPQDKVHAVANGARAKIETILNGRNELTFTNHVLVIERTL